MHVPEELLARLREHRQEHLLAHWDNLEDPEREHLLGELEEVDFAKVLALYGRRKERVGALAAHNLRPLDFLKLADQSASQISRWERTAAGEFRSGRVAALLVAGGQGTRLGHNGPKGSFPFAIPSGRTLFELQALRLLNLGRRFGKPVPWLVMTSPINDADTRAFFAEHGFFGLDPEDVFFFSQGQLPAVGEDGRLLLEAPDQLALVPDGNGGVFAALARSGGLDWLKARGVRSVFLYSVDNAIVRVCDPALVGFHVESGKAVTCPVVRKAGPNERVGIFVDTDEGSCVAEYSDIPEEMRNATDERGHLLYDGANLAIHVLDVGVLQDAAEQALPYHSAFKRVPWCREDGTIVLPEKENAWKFEQFMFDVFPRFGKMAALEVERSDWFSPIKNSSGNDSPATAIRMMLDLHSRWLVEAGVLAPDDPRKFEISPLWSYAGENLRGRSISELLEKGAVVQA